MQYLRARSLFFTVLAHGKIYYPAFTQNVIIMHCPKTEYTVKERCNWLLYETMWLVSDGINASWAAFCHLAFNENLSNLNK